MKQTSLIGAFMMVCGALAAQTPPNQPIYRISVTSRTTKAISYQHRGGSTHVDFQGTDLLPTGRGEAKVESKQGRISIEAEFNGLLPASKNGLEYLTYVLWAITPEGRTANLGEILLDGAKSKLNVTTELQVFALVVTAEPYYAVSRPSDLVVMENVVRADTRGKVEEIDAKYELLQRGQYQRLANPLMLKADSRLPIELYEGRNAVQIARAEGADRFAAESFEKAVKNLAQAEEYQSRHAGKKAVEMTAREAVQMAEDSRVIAVKRQEEEAVNAERAQLMEREGRAESGRAAAQSETDRVTRQAEAARIAAQADSERLTKDSEKLAREKDAQTAASLAEAGRVKSENDSRMAAAGVEADRLKQEHDAKDAAAGIVADRLRLENEAKIAAAGAESDRLKHDSDAQMAKASAEADRLKLENDAKIAAAGAESDRLKHDSDTQMAAANTEAHRLRVDSDAKIAAAGAEADRLKLENDAQRLASQADLDSAAKQTARLEAEKVELRIQLLAQFNAILQTRDTARGLIVNMSDVLFDTGKSTLRPAAREKMAKVAGIVSGHPGLRLDVEGHTDSVGGDQYNQELSEHRADAVRSYLTEQGMAGSSVSAKGFGKTQPVASNDTAEGRQQNRRVELVISGLVIGTEIGTPIVVR